MLIKLGNHAITGHGARDKDGNYYGLKISLPSYWVNKNCVKGGDKLQAFYNPDRPYQIIFQPRDIEIDTK